MGDSMDCDIPQSTDEERDVSLPVLLASLSELVSSPEPAVVFASLVRLAVPAVCEAAMVTVAGEDEKVYAVSWPQDAASSLRLRSSSVTTIFDVPASVGYPPFRGEVAFRFGSTHPARPFVAQVMVDRALASIERARLLADAEEHKAVADHLESALVSNREIGVAVGILMATRELEAAEAFDLLRRASQARNQKLRLIATEVVDTGRLSSHLYEVK